MILKKLRIFLLPVSAVFELVSFVVATVIHVFSVQFALRICDFWLAMPDTDWYLAGWRGGK